MSKVILLRKERERRFRITAIKFHARTLFRAAETIFLFVIIHQESCCVKRTTFT